MLGDAGVSGYYNERDAAGYGQACLKTALAFGLTTLLFCLQGVWCAIEVLMPDQLEERNNLTPNGTSLTSRPESIINPLMIRAGGLRLFFPNAPLHRSRQTYKLH